MPRAERIDGWSVTIEVNGERVLCISNQHLAGIPDIEKYRDIVLGAAEHLRSFMGEGASSVELANRELIGLLEEARGAVLKRRIDAARGELWGVVKDCDDLLARIDARIGGKE